MRKSGVLLPISSLPGKYGIGAFSKESYEFVDFLVEGKQKLWQILPLGPTGYGDSPYQSFSTFAGNPYFISLEELVEEGLLEDPVTDEIAQRYLSVLIDSGIDTLILGCTHYPLIRSTVGRVMGDKVTLVNPAYETAIELKRLLEEKNILQDEKPALGTNQYQFFVSDGAEKFQHFANTIFKYGVLAVKQINIEEY